MTTTKLHRAPKPVLDLYDTAQSSLDEAKALLGVDLTDSDVHAAVFAVRAAHAAILELECRLRGIKPAELTE